MIDIHAMRPEERSKVWSWWMRVLRKGVSYSHKQFAGAVDKLIDDPETRVLVAELGAVPGEPLGFVAHQDADLLMVFVLAEVNGVPSRRQGFGSALLDAALAEQPYVNIRHFTRPGRALMDAWKQNNPGRRAA